MSKIAKWLGGAAAVALALGSFSANAQTPIKFTLDWVFQGPTSPFLVALEKGYYKAEGLDVTMDPGQGSAGAVQRLILVPTGKAATKGSSRRKFCCPKPLTASNSLVRVIGKKPEHTHVVIQEINEEDWGFSGVLTDEFRKKQH